ncbi:MAG: hypothetical protein KF768_06370 [Phycisphaeraceae bacterium]|nr:hypothetical protein [Phycisphaeraceae bacterium]
MLTLPIRSNAPHATITLAAGLALALTAAAAHAAPTVNGTVAGADMYGPALAVQTTQTAWTDNMNELNAAYGLITAGRLYLAFTGNLANNFNNLEIFIDSRAGGQNVYASAGNDNTSAMNGFTFDSGFNADYHLNVRHGLVPSTRFNLDFADLQAGAFSQYVDVFGGSATGATSTGTGINSSPIEIAFNNSNMAGVIGGSGAADQAAAAAATTGIELSIALADLGLPPGEIRVFAFINNTGHNFASNQFLPGLVTPQDFLGSDGAGGFTGSLSQLNMNTYYPGAAQGWFTVVPAPGALALLGMSGFVGLRRRR